jgi:hypothetical protein
MVTFYSFEVDLPEFRPEGLECVDLLPRLASDGKFNYSADVQRGLILERWLDAQEFARMLELICREEYRGVLENIQAPNSIKGS